MPSADELAAAGTPLEGSPYTVAERLARVEVSQHLAGAALNKLGEDVTAIRNELSGRPSWAVTALLAASMAGNGALLSALVVIVSSSHFKP